MTQIVINAKSREWGRQGKIAGFNAMDDIEISFRDLRSDPPKVLSRYRLICGHRGTLKLEKIMKK